MSGSVFAVGCPPALLERMRGVMPVVSAPATVPKGPVALVVGPGVERPVAVALRWLEQTPHVAILFLAPGPRLAELQSLIQFTPKVREAARAESLDGSGDLQTCIDEAQARAHRFHDAATRRAPARRPAVSSADAPVPDGFLRSFFDRSLELLCVADTKGFFLHLNPVWETTLGWSRAELMSRPFLDFVHPDDHEATAAEAARLAEGHLTVYFENRYRRNDGTYRWFAWTAGADRARGLLLAVARDITETKRMTEALHKARAEAEAATRAKSAFLANMSHEIRTPLNAVIGLSSILQTTRLDQEQARMLDVIQKSGQHLLTVINDVLDLSKIEAGALVLSDAPFDLRATVEEALALVAEPALSKGLDLGYVYEKGTPEGIRGDSARLRQVLLNLLGNAVKFTDAGGVEVKVSVAAAGPDARGVLEVLVVDTGKGISQEDQTHLFRPFTQVDDTHTRQHEGTGLGLAITRRLVHAMGGSIGVDSTPGKGSTFWFHLPLERVTLDAHHPWEQDSDALRGLRLVVVDDNPVNLEIVAHHVANWGVDVTTTTDPVAALADCRAGKYDVGIVDHHMPGLDGLEFAHRLADAEGEVAVPLVLFTSRLLSKDEGKRARARFEAVLAKPLRPRELFRVLHGIVKPAEAAHGEDAGPEDEEPVAEHRPLRILVAEDNAANRMVATAMLGRLGYTPDLVENGHQALEAAHQRAYDLVLMDIQMPVMDGFSATEAIRERLGATAPPIVAMTAHAGVEEQRRCLEAGMVDVVVKPVTVAALSAALRHGRSRAATPATSEEAASPDTDLAALSEVFGDDHASLVAFIGSVAGDARALVDALGDEGIGGGDLADLLHRVAPNAGLVGAQQLMDRARAAERDVRDGKRPTEELAWLRQEAQRLVDRLGRWRPPAQL